MTKVSKKYPLISIIVPVYNIDIYVSQCIESLIKQSYKKIEIILVDDGSTDDSGRICDDFEKKDKRIFVMHKINGGLSDARNVGVEMSHGEYIIFVDGDDYVDIEYVEKLYDTMAKNKTDIAITSYRIIYPKRQIDVSTSNKFIEKKELILERLLYDDDVDVTACSKIYKRSLFEKIKFPKGRLYEDTATTYLLLDASNAISVNSIATYNYVMRSNSISKKMFNQKKFDLIVSTKEMCDFISMKYPKLRKACNRRLVYAYLSTISQLVQSKNAGLYAKEKKELVYFVKQNGIDVLIDARTPLRDKIGILVLKFGGYTAYSISWKLYKFFSGRQSI